MNKDLKKNSSQKNGGIGSTGRGIGPCYEDKVGRRGITIDDLYNEKILKEKLEKISEFYPDYKMNIDFLIKRLKPYIEKIKPFVFQSRSSRST